MHVFSNSRKKLKTKYSDAWYHGPKFLCVRNSTMIWPGLTCYILGAADKTDSNTLQHDCHNSLPMILLYRQSMHRRIKKLHLGLNIYSRPILELIWVRAYTLLTPHMGNHLQLPYLLAHLHASNNSKKFKYGKNRLNILDLKILQVFFKTRGKILFLKKMLNSLSFLVLLCVSGNFKQNFFFQNFSDW